MPEAFRPSRTVTAALPMSLDRVSAMRLAELVEDQVHAYRAEIEHGLTRRGSTRHDHIVQEARALQELGRRLRDHVRHYDKTSSNGEITP